MNRVSFTRTTKAEVLFGEIEASEEGTQIRRNVKCLWFGRRIAKARGFHFKSEFGGLLVKQKEFSRGVEDGNGFDNNVAFCAYKSGQSSMCSSFYKEMVSFVRIKDQRTTFLRVMSNAKSGEDPTDGRTSAGERRQNIYEERGSGADNQRANTDSYDGESSRTEGNSASFSSLQMGENAGNVPQPRQELDAQQSDEFERLMDEGGALLKEAQEGLDGKVEVGVAERMLNEAADVFAAANAIDPLDLAALEGWGNTLLVHGQLKLKLSKQLRAMLSEANARLSYSKRKTGMKAQGQQGWEPARIERMLQGVCEECEELLVEAGRKYRMALSLDKNDVRALYNWGLALCYRAQLIAAEGDENALKDADKVYLAAIAKFEAMMTMDKKYAAGGLLNWGLALRDRSWLRPIGSNERIKLLQEARLIFQDALQYDPNYTQAKMAVAACIEELQELQDYDGNKSKRVQKQRAENWWDWN